MQASVRQVSTVALFVPLLIILALMSVTGHHSTGQWILAVTVLCGFPLAVLALRRRAARVAWHAPRPTTTSAHASDSRSLMA